MIYLIYVKTYREIFDRYQSFMSEDDRKKFAKRIKETDDCSRLIQHHTGRIERVVRTLTGTLRESTGEMESLNLAVFFQRVLEASRFTTGEENLTSCEAKLNIARNLLVFGNADQLEQVFLNLIKKSFAFYATFMHEDDGDRWI